MGTLSKSCSQAQRSTPLVLRKRKIETHESGRRRRRRKGPDLRIISQEMERSIAVRFLLFYLCFFLPLLNRARASLSPQGLEGVNSRSLLHEKEHAHEVHCSRERSRAAWQIIEEYLMPFVEKEHYKIPSGCRIHADNDLFRDQEMHKIHVDINDWQCGYCKKSFRAEKFLDQHFDNRHYNLLNVSHGKCLADLCGALHCDLVMDSKFRKTKCNPAAASRNHHLCESLADSCFPVGNGPSARRLHELFLRQFCDAHSCTGGQKPFSRGGRKQTSTFYIAISILTLMLLPIFYLLVYLYQREMRVGIQDLRRISKGKHKTKPS